MKVGDLIWINRNPATKGIAIIIEVLEFDFYHVLFNASRMMMHSDFIELVDDALTSS